MCKTIIDKFVFDSVLNFRRVTHFWLCLLETQVYINLVYTVVSTELFWTKYSWCTTLLQCTLYSQYTTAHNCADRVDSTVNNLHRLYSSDCTVQTVQFREYSSDCTVQTVQQSRRGNERTRDPQCYGASKQKVGQLYT